jgi:molecular chaperone GrpE
MTRPSEHPQDIPAGDGAAHPDKQETPSPASEGSAGALAAAEARVAELEARLAELNDKALRALAEAENTRKRMEKERQDTAKFAVSSFARDLLGVADNLGRALAAITPEQRMQDGPLKTIFTGVEATERELLRSLENNGIKKIDPAGQAFDPNLHEVMFEIDAPDQKPGTILQVLEPAYTIHDRLLRSARVGVARGGIAPEGSQIDENV